MSDLVTCGAVLRETETKEADKILTVLTADHGRISVIARGARRKSCRFAAACQTLAYSELALTHRGDWYYLNEGTTRALFDGLRTADYPTDTVEQIIREELAVYLAGDATEDETAERIQSRVYLYLQEQ